MPTSSKSAKSSPAKKSLSSKEAALKMPPWRDLRLVSLAVLALCLATVAMWAGYAAFIRPVAESCSGTHKVEESTGVIKYDGSLVSFEYLSTQATPWRNYYMLDHVVQPEEDKRSCHLSTMPKTELEQNWARFIPPVLGLQDQLLISVSEKLSKKTYLSVNFSHPSDAKGESLEELKRTFTESMEQQQRSAEADRQRGRTTAFEPAQYSFEDVDVNGHPSTKVNMSRASSESLSRWQIYYVTTSNQIVGTVTFFASGTNKAAVDAAFEASQANINSMLSTVVFK